MQRRFWRQTRSRPIPLTCSVVWQTMARSRNFYSPKRSIFGLKRGRKAQCVSNRCKDLFKQKKRFWGYGHSNIVANPSPSSLSYLLIYRLLPCLSPKLLVANFSRPLNPQDAPQALIDEHLQLLRQSLHQPPRFRTIQEHRLQIWTKDSQLGLGC